MHTGRFAVFYRQTYGHSPHTTLRGRHGWCSCGVVLDWQTEPNEDAWRTHPTTGSEPMTDPESARAAREKWHRWRELAQDELDDIDPGDPSKEYERAKAAAWLQHSEREYDKVAAVYDQF
jgi:hypothetical protein